MPLPAGEVITGTLERASDEVITVERASDVSISGRSNCTVPLIHEARDIEARDLSTAVTQHLIGLLLPYRNV